MGLKDTTLRVYADPIVGQTIVDLMINGMVRVVRALSFPDVNQIAVWVPFWRRSREASVRFGTKRVLVIGRASESFSLGWTWRHSALEADDFRFVRVAA